jgi:hypothetical protein
MQAAGIEMEGPTDLQHLMNVHFSSTWLAERTRDRSSMLYFVYNKVRNEVMWIILAFRIFNRSFRGALWPRGPERLGVARSCACYAEEAL